jgi:hypothetical protein
MTIEERAVGRKRCCSKVALTGMNTQKILNKNDKGSGRKTKIKDGQSVDD